MKSLFLAIKSAENVKSFGVGRSPEETDAMAGAFRLFTSHLVPIMGILKAGHGVEMEKTNTPQQREFFEALTTGDVVRVRQMVSEDAELLSAYDYSYYGATPVTRICGNDQREMIGALLELGADLNRRSDWEMGAWSPLHSAIVNGNDSLAEYLLDAGAILDVHTAAALGRVDDLKRLLDEQPERISERGGDGCHPLHFAGTVEAAQTLLDRGADINARCLDHYSTPVQYLATVRPEVTRFLLANGAEADIFTAILAGDHEVLTRLLAENSEVIHERVNQERFPPGPDFDVHNMLTFTVGFQATPLHAAAKANDAEAIRQLIQAGLKPDVRGGYDEGTPLHIAAWEDHVEAAAALVENGADVNIRSGENHDNSPAGWAIVAGSNGVFSYLLDHGAESLPWFQRDVEAGVNGQFEQYRSVPPENREQILKRLADVG